MIETKWYFLVTRHSPLIIHDLHSVRNDFTGFASAALIAWKPTVINAMSNAATPATTYIQTPM
jgi:hypothetical protein